jgi:Putative transposase
VNREYLSNRIKVMRLDAVEFLRRFLLHVLPAGFVKIRHFGLLANRNRRHSLTLCRQHLNSAEPEPAALLTPQQVAALHRCCPHCHCGTLRIVARLSAAMIATCVATHRTINSS